MKNTPIQFSIAGLLLALPWIAFGLATVPLIDWSRFLEDFLDDDGDNVFPRMLLALWCSLAACAIGALQRRPIIWFAKIFVVWIGICGIIVFVAILPVAL